MSTLAQRSNVVYTLASGFKRILRQDGSLVTPPWGIGPIAANSSVVVFLPSTGDLEVYQSDDLSLPLIGSIPRPSGSALASPRLFPNGDLAVTGRDTGSGLPEFVKVWDGSSWTRYPSSGVLGTSPNPNVITPDSGGGGVYYYWGQGTAPYPLKHYEFGSGAITTIWEPNVDITHTGYYELVGTTASVVDLGDTTLLVTMQDALTRTLPSSSQVFNTAFDGLYRIHNDGTYLAHITFSGYGPVKWVTRDAIGSIWCTAVNTTTTATEILRIALDGTLLDSYPLSPAAAGYELWGGPTLGPPTPVSGGWRLGKLGLGPRTGGWS